MGFPSPLGTRDYGAPDKDTYFIEGWNLVWWLPVVIGDAGRVLQCLKSESGVLFNAG
jgi:hypothetical protein